MKKLFILVTFTIFSVNYVFSVPAKPVITKVLQKNGTEISIRQHGDEHFHFKTTEDGILITENADGIFEYAKMSENGDISSTGILAKNKDARSNEEISFTNTLNNKNVFEISMDVINKRVEQKNTMKSPAAQNAVGEKGIVILVNFKDKAFVTTNANTAFKNLLNQEGYSLYNAKGSARDYFIECSNSLFKPTFDVYGPYTLPQNMSYYGGNNSYGDKNPQQMIIDACNSANNDVNFAQYDTDGDGFVDNVFVFYAGFSEASGADANTVWPHRSVVVYNKNSAPLFDGVRVYDYACSSELKGTSGTTMDGIGTFCHEFSHVLGLPDLYNTANDDDTNMMFWDLMDMGCYNGPNKNGDVPAMYSAYEMFYVGWLTPEILTKCGNYTLTALENSPKKAYLVAKTDTHNLNGKSPNATEFYMIENRQQISYDTYLPNSGLLITRINYSGSKWMANTVNNTTPKGVEIMKAGTSAYGNDWLFPTSSKKSFSFVSATGGTAWNKSVSEITKNTTAKTVSFNFQQQNCPTAVDQIKDNEFEIINFPLNWYISMDYSNYSMEIYTVNGILLKTFEFENEITVEKNSFPNGVYMLKIKDLNTQKVYFSKAIK